MRSQFFIPFFLLPISAVQIPSIFAEFNEPQSALNDTAVASSNELVKRDGNCPVNYNSCSTLANNLAAACCIQGSVCSKDRSNHVACCPIGATCTGTIVLGSPLTTGGAVFGGATTVNSVSATITGAPFATGTVSYVQNGFFPFPYIPTMYANSAACNSAYDACQTNYAACTAGLVGNAFGVTVVAPGGAGVTIAPTVAAVAPASATSICSSLSSQACYAISSDSCAVFGNGQFDAGSTSGVKRTSAVSGLAVAMVVMTMVGVML